jgi:hypothetical protein
MTSTTIKAVTSTATIAEGRAKPNDPDPIIAPKEMRRDRFANPEYINKPQYGKRLPY